MVFTKFTGRRGVVKKYSAFVFRVNNQINNNMLERLKKRMALEEYSPRIALNGNSFRLPLFISEFLVKLNAKDKNRGSVQRIQFHSVPSRGMLVWLVL